MSEEVISRLKDDEKMLYFARTNKTIGELMDEIVLWWK